MFRTAHYLIHDSQPSSIMMELQHRVNEVMVVTCYGAACTSLQRSPSLICCHVLCCWENRTDRLSFCTFSDPGFSLFLFIETHHSANYITASCTFRKTLKVECPVELIVCSGLSECESGNLLLDWLSFTTIVLSSEWH